ncbi:MAG TPA: hypothetical protein VJ911_00905 [Cryomorphaceae bacterium]|nr:hypothetical protein [Cryomorphaceae bacterium]
MKAAEIITYQPTHPDALGQALAKSLDYALLSFPFTVNRMNLRSPKARISNIVKGKLAEALLEQYAFENQIPMDFTAGETPFWTRDHFDFKLGETAFDLKNNFVHANDILSAQSYLHLPALVPNRFEGDQWSKRNSSAEGATERAFVFSFISQGATYKTPLFKLKIESEQVNFLIGVLEEHAKKEFKGAPFTRNWFFSELNRRGPKPTVELKRKLELVLCGMAGEGEFEKFLDTDGRENFGYAMYQKRWYALRAKTGLSFMDGLVTTKIKNATCPMEALPSFKSFIRAFEK